MGKTKMSALLPANIYNVCIKSFFGSKFYAKTEKLVKPEKEICFEKQNLPPNLSESLTI